MKAGEYESFDAVGLAELIERSEVSPTELLACAVDQIERQNGQLNAVVDKWFERAEQQIQAGLPEGPFTGVPMLVKDDLALAGTAMTLGSGFMKNQYVCAKSHPVADRIQAAGFVLLGRTNMSELGLLPTTEPRCFGPTRNPWSIDTSPGGSSGGAAAAVAARMVPIAGTSDGGGSTRIPASACGLVGLKPSRGRHPTIPDDDGVDGFIVRSAVTRSVRDCAAYLDLTAGAHPSARFTLPAPTRSYRQVIGRDPSTFRIGFMVNDHCGVTAHDECKEAVERTAKLLERLGHQVEPSGPTIDGAAFNEAFLALWAMCAGFYFKRVRTGIGERLPPWMRPVLRNPIVFGAITRLAQKSIAPPFESFTRRLANIDARNSPSDLWAAWCTMHQADRAFATYFESYDMLLCPVLGKPPWKTGFFRHDWSEDELRAQLFPYLGQTHIMNTTGLPAIALPLQWTATGIPIGVQLVAPWGREDLLLALAAQLERAQPWAHRYPPSQQPRLGDDSRD